MERVVVNRSFTLYKTFYADGVPADPTGTPTVAITRVSTGATVTSGVVTNEVQAGTWSVTVAAPQNTLLDTLTVTWTATVNATPQQYVDTVEVAGDTVFTVADVRATSWGSATTNTPGEYRLSMASIAAARTEVERMLEHELGFAMVPRYTRETVDGSGLNAFMLTQPYIRNVRSATVAGVSLDVPTVATLMFTPSGRLYYPAGWTAGYSNVIVGYEHGLSTPPPGAKQVALALARRMLTGSAADDRATTMSTEEQTTTFYVPGESEPFDVPAANRFVASQNMRVGLA